MGKKYIIELEETETAYKTVNSGGWPMIQLLNKEPYIEPDLEQIRKEAYEQGRKDGKVEGREEAWNAAKKIALDKEDGGLDTVAYCETFGYGKGFGTVLKTFTASEVIEKIRQYEQEKEEHEIKAGDEVFCVDCPDIKIWVIDVHDNGFSGIALSDVNGCCDMGDMFKEEPLKNYAKTGNHHEIAEVLRKIGGSE